MSHFVFSADAHMNEPKTLWLEGLPASMRDRALRTEKRDGFIYMIGGGKELHRMQLGDGNSGVERKGLYEIKPRLEDMKNDGIDAEILFPQLGLMTSCVGDAELELAHCVLYNDWAMKHVEGYRHVFVPVAALPVLDLKNAVPELKRCIGLGYNAVMVPCGRAESIPSYNAAAWDHVWEVAAANGVVIIFHTGTGPSRLFERGPGAAVLNYLGVSDLCITAIAQMVLGGALDRFPGLQIVSVEAGASYLLSLAERMDESYIHHQYYVKPKLAMLPSAYLKRQVKATFQYDRSCILARSRIGVESLLFATDYPHMEGTFPNTPKVIEDLFAGIDIAESEKAAILGGNSKRLFRLQDAH